MSAAGPHFPTLAALNTALGFTRLSLKPTEAFEPMQLAFAVGFEAIATHHKTKGSVIFEDLCGRKRDASAIERHLSTLLTRNKFSWPGAAQFLYFLKSTSDATTIPPLDLSPRLYKSRFETNVIEQLFKRVDKLRSHQSTAYGLHLIDGTQTVLVTPAKFSQSVSEEFKESGVAGIFSVIIGLARMTVLSVNSDVHYLIRIKEPLLHDAMNWTSHAANKYITLLKTDPETNMKDGLENALITIGGFFRLLADMIVENDAGRATPEFAREVALESYPNFAQNPNVAFRTFHASRRSLMTKFKSVNDTAPAPLPVEIPAKFTYQRLEDGRVQIVPEGSTYTEAMKYISLMRAADDAMRAQHSLPPEQLDYVGCPALFAEVRPGVNAIRYMYEWVLDMFVNEYFPKRFASR